MIVAPRVDGVVVVVDADTTTGGAASHTIDQLEQVGGNVIGSVLNRFDPSKARYYSYAGQYAYAYRYHDRHEDSGTSDKARTARTGALPLYPHPPTTSGASRSAQGLKLRAARTDPGRRHPR